MKLYTGVPKATTEEFEVGNAMANEATHHGAEGGPKNVAEGKAMATEAIHCGAEGAAEEYFSWQAHGK